MSTLADNGTNGIFIGDPGFVFCQFYAGFPVQPIDCCIFGQPLKTFLTVVIPIDGSQLVTHLVEKEVTGHRNGAADIKGPVGIGINPALGRR